NGYFQGKERVLSLSVVFNLPMAVRIIASVVLVYAGLELVGATASFPFGYAVVVFPLALYYGWLSGEEDKTAIDINSSFLRILATNILMVAFIHSDLFAIRLLMGPEQAAFYNTAGITGRIPFYMSNAIAFVLLPQAAKLTFENRRELATRFLKSLAFIVPIAPVFVLFAKPLLTLFYGPLYGESGAGAFSILVIGMVIFGAANFLVSILWSQGKETLPLALSLLIVPVNILLLYVLVPERGLEGGAIATLISSSIFFLVSGGAFVYYMLDHRNMEPGRQ
ncbi:MAG: polysaccharide biosynthesis C-terminal domain-containing protein, partial [Candidatus Micrarchaeota archaeon]